MGQIGGGGPGIRRRAPVSPRIPLRGTGGAATGTLSNLLNEGCIEAKIAVSRFLDSLLVPFLASLSRSLTLGLLSAFWAGFVGREDWRLDGVLEVGLVSSAFCLYFLVMYRSCTCVGKASESQLEVT